MIEQIIKYRRDIALIVLISVIVFWSLKFLSPTITSMETYKTKIDSIQNNIKNLQQEQSLIDYNVSRIKDEIYDVEDKIEGVKTEKVIIKEYYEKQINNIDKYTDAQLDSFFSERYGRLYTN